VNERTDSLKKVSEVLFGEAEFKSLKAEDLKLLVKELPTKEAKLPADILDCVVDTGLASSKGEARRFLQSGALYVNNEQCSSDKTELDKSDAHEGYVLLRRGKNVFALVKVN